MSTPSASQSRLLTAVELAIRGQGATPITLYPKRSSPRETRGIVTQQLDEAESGQMAYAANTIILTLAATDTEGFGVDDLVIIEGRNYTVMGITGGSARHITYRITERAP